MGGMIPRHVTSLRQACQILVGQDVETGARSLLIRHELNLNTVRAEPVEALPFDRLRANGLANKLGRINSDQGTNGDSPLACGLLTVLW